MPKYNSFNEYLQDNYFNQIKESLEEYVSENGIRSDDYNIAKSNQFEILSINVFKVQFTKSEFNNVEFKFFIKAMFLLNEDLTRNVESFVGKMQGSFKKGFKLKDNVEVTDEEEEGVFTKDLVPVMCKDDYDKFASRFLRHFYPEALETPTKLDISKIIKNSDLKYYSVTLKNNILGVIYFADDEVQLINDDGTQVKINVNPGTVLINKEKVKERGLGASRNTFIHEAVHWFFHRNYFELRQLLDNKQTCAVCYRSFLNSTNNEIEWMEKQARALTPRILMPKKQFLLKYREIKLDVESKLIEYSKAEKIYKIVKELAKFFGVSNESAKYRLMELGVMEAAGVCNYCDGKTLQKFSFKDKFLKDHQTFIIDYQSYSRLMENNPHIREAVLKHKLLYLNGMLIANNSKYIIYSNSGYKLTEYALSNAHECALLFNIYHDYKETISSKDKCFFMFSTSTNKKLNASVDEEQLVNVLASINEDFIHFEEHKKKMPLDFCGTLNYHMTKNNFSQTELSDKCDVNEKYISQALSGKRTPTVIEIIKIALTMKLSYPYICDLLVKVGHMMIPLSADQSTLLACLMVKGRRDLLEAYKALKVIGREHLLGLSKKFIQEYDL